MGTAGRLGWNWGVCLCVVQLHGWEWEGGPTSRSPVLFQSCYVPHHVAATSAQQGSQGEAEEAAGSISGKEYIKAVHRHPAYLTSMLSTSLKCWAGWITSWNQGCQEKYQSPQICRWHHPYGRKWRGTKEPLDKVKLVSEKAGLKPKIQKMKIMASRPMTSWQIDGETMETVTDFILGGPKSLQMVTAAMKLKDACPLEEKLWPT